MPGTDPAPLRATRGVRGVGFFVKIDYTVDRLEGAGRLYEAHIVAYRYRVLDPSGRELLAYHWHPEGVSPVTFPHGHVSNAAWTTPRPRRAADDPPPLVAMHLPTGPVALADVVRLLIAEFGVAARQADWEDVLREVRDVPEAAG